MPSSQSESTAEVSPTTDLRCPVARASLLASLPSLSVTSRRTALSLFNVLQLSQKIPLEELVERACLPELLAILSLARHHPAFRIEHRLALSDLWFHFYGLHHQSSSPLSPRPDSQVQPAALEPSSPPVFAEPSAIDRPAPSSLPLSLAK